MKRKFSHEEIIVATVVIFCISSFTIAFGLFIHNVVILGETGLGTPLW